MLQTAKEDPTVLTLEDAKPCPWCGEQPTIQPWHGGRSTKRMVGCDNEECSVRPCVSGQTRLEALLNWNTRKE